MVITWHLKLIGSFKSIQVQLYGWIFLPDTQKQGFNIEYGWMFLPDTQKQGFNIEYGWMFLPDTQKQGFNIERHRNNVLNILISCNLFLNGTMLYNSPIQYSMVRDQSCFIGNHELSPDTRKYTWHKLTWNDCFVLISQPDRLYCVWHRTACPLSLTGVRKTWSGLWHR